MLRSIKAYFHRKPWRAPAGQWCIGKCCAGADRNPPVVVELLRKPLGLRVGESAGCAAHPGSPVYVRHTGTRECSKCYGDSIGYCFLHKEQFAKPQWRDHAEHLRVLMIGGADLAGCYECRAERRARLYAY